MPDFAGSTVVDTGQYPDVAQLEEITTNQFKDVENLIWIKGMPDPMFWRLLVAPTRPPKISKGGIHLPDSSHDAQEYLNFMGKILAVGPLVGVHTRLQHRDPEINARMRRPVVGDWVAYSRFAAQRFIYRDIRLLLIDEENLLAYLDEGPEGYKIYV